MGQEEKEWGTEGLKLIWENDLKTEIKIEDWIKMWRMRVLRLMLIRIKKTYICLRWYMTPVKLNIINSDYSKACWKCDEEIDMYYMW